ncbi:hypothetical protein M422DRAFT_260274 [Sphaerobolus stellatus SS14]|uniref:N-acetyltransferase domain-containing protein n=1 Tax=Sphaerobolus stellatus (strain SS14) TaxID=990650 RepID=A0A0C9VJ34_SPHS4|nr:hypothetical protein M422DRAFT_260274 [Sphaerobolus stellatus SS14]
MDYASFGWLGDVYVLEEYRGRGLGKWLVQVAVNLEEIKECQRLMLMTKDTEGLYRRYGGFELLKKKVLERYQDIQILYGEPDKDNTEDKAST